MSKSIQEWQSQIHQLACEKGWWDSGGRNIGELLALVHSEVSEALEEYRKSGESSLDRIYYTDTSGLKAESGKPEGFGIELADTVIRIMDMCEGLGIDLEKAMEIKMNYNKTRPFRHGNKKA